MMPKYMIFIGPGRSGTSFIDNVLRCDDRISLPRGIKETNYFLSNSDVEAYQRYFSKDDRVRVEVTNMYIYSKDAAVNLKQLPCDTKLIAVLRNPFDRLLSSLKYRISVGEIGTKDSLAEYIKAYPDLLEQSLYAGMLYNYRDLKGQLSLFLFDELTSDPASFFEKIYRELELHPLDSIPSVSTNESVSARFVFLSKVVRVVANFLREKGFLTILGFFKKNTFIRSVVFKTGEVDVGALEFDEKTISIINEDIKRLGSLTNIDFSHWMRGN